MNLVLIEDFVEAKVQKKFDRLSAELEAREKHRSDLKSWAQIADRAAFRLKVYEQRREWINKVVESGLCNSEEAFVLASLKFKI